MFLNVKLYTLIALLFLAQIGYAGEVYNIDIKWSAIEENVITDAVTHKFISFENAQYNFADNKLPVFYKRVAVYAGQETDWHLSNENYVDVTAEEEKLIKADWLTEEVKIVSNIGYNRGKSQASVYFVPIRKKRNSNKHEKLVSFELTLTTISVSNVKPKSILKSFTGSSVLTNGSWFRVGVTSNGVYQMDYDFLKSNGVDVDNINPRLIQVYGNGAGMLPKKNSDPRKDDLLENAIYVEGENDGVFDKEDFVLFYGEGPNEVVFDKDSLSYSHITHLYSDSSYYYVTYGSGFGKRQDTLQSSALQVTHSVNSYDDFIVHELDAVNVLKSGDEWLGEFFDITENYNFNYSIANVDTTGLSHLYARCALNSTIESSYDITVNGTNTITTIVKEIIPLFYTSYYNEGIASFDFNATNSINLAFQYNKSTSTSVAYLDYFELTIRRFLLMDGSQLPFMDGLSVDSGNVAEYAIGGFSNTTTVWDVTSPSDVKLQVGVLSGSDFTFSSSANSLRKYIAFDASDYMVPAYIGSVENQNLHGLSNKEMIIVCHPDFLSEAERLADYHRDRDNLSIHIVTPQQIYNEFSSGSQDVVAIRDFIRMFYERSNYQLPLYLLLFGEGSFDNKNRIPGNNNFIVSYESPESAIPTQSYVSDDYFVFLDSNEGVWNRFDADYLDVGIGRIPVSTLYDATNVVNKILNYHTSSTTGKWRNIVAVTSDDEDGNIHVNQAETLSGIIADSGSLYNIDKIYLDAFLQITTSNGDLYPDATIAFNERMKEGALFINYTGHGGELGWTDENFVQTSDINSLENVNNLPLFVTATCEFSRWDDPTRVSAGEFVLLNPVGGGIALFTTVRLVFSSPNFILNKHFLRHVFEKVDGKHHRLGDLIRITKNEMSPGVNHRNFTLLGDPALTLAYPDYNVITEQLNGIAVDSADTIRALSAVTIKGYIADDNGVKVTDYNGLLYPTFFDKVTELSTLANDKYSVIRAFEMQNEIVYDGKVSIDSGAFSFTFVIPKSIKPAYGNAKMSYYATNGQLDAAGHYSDFILGGIDTTAAGDDVGPEIQLYIGDEKFQSGDVISGDLILYSELFDSSGINLGTGIGHDIRIIIDGDESNPVILNSEYEPEVDSYQKGRIVYTLPDLGVGDHTIEIKAWDIHNNSTNLEIEFVLIEEVVEDFAITHVLNYPNPFTTNTSFSFQHNRPGEILDIEIQIFTMSGLLVKSLVISQKANGLGIDGVNWDGLNNYGEKIGKGVYVYRIKVRSEDGSALDQFEKLVLLN